MHFPSPYYAYYYLRCHRELRRSKSLSMLDVAYKYCELFCNYLERKAVQRKVIETVSRVLLTEYRRAKYKIMSR